ncbi:hypothetical protein B4135_3991 [Caldibacillus debilis]|uniref:Uncharacterized protein n=1 Tax=Caldibacillus debilis TaxID=301148 RepID=A0A150L7Z6_9BACI|nr:hypothetical protein B4135_3991 [Caldibacillus debilis]
MEAGFFCPLFLLKHPAFPKEHVLFPEKAAYTLPETQAMRSIH